MVFGDRVCSRAARVVSPGRDDAEKQKFLVSFYGKRRPYKFSSLHDLKIRLNLEKVERAEKKLQIFGKDIGNGNGNGNENYNNMDESTSGSK